MLEREKALVAGIGAEAFARLVTELSGSRPQSVLLEVLRQRARRRTPSELRRQYEADAFCALATDTAALQR